MILLKGCERMPLGTNDKLKLLGDILKNQQTNAKATKSECLQTERLIQSLTNYQEAVDPVLKETLSTVKTYNQEALQQNDSNNNHTFQYETAMEQWIETIDKTIDKK
jgi:hypothetical protein